MIIPQTENAIKFYKLAIKNAQNALEFHVNQDEKYQLIQRKMNKRDYIVGFYGRTQSFSVYKWEDMETIEFFKVEDGEIIYNKENTFDGIEKVAEELLQIVKKFY